MKHTRFKAVSWLWRYLYLAVTLAVCFALYYWGGNSEKIRFAIDIVVIIFLSLRLYYAVFKGLRRGMAESVVFWISVFIFANGLYDYKKLRTAFPVLDTVDPAVFSVIVLCTVLFILFLIRIFIYACQKDTIAATAVPPSRSDQSGAVADIYSAVDLESAAERRVISADVKSMGMDALEPDRNKRSNASAVLYGLALLASLSAVCGLLVILHHYGVLKQDYDLIEVLALVIKYASMVIMVLLTAVIIVVFLIEMLRVMAERGRALLYSLKDGRQGEGIPLYAVSAALAVIVCYCVYNYVDFTVDSFLDFIENGRYIAFPLSVLFVAIAFVVFVRLIHATLLMLKGMTAQNVTVFLGRVDEKTKIKERIIKIIKTITDIILDSAITVLEFIKFIPDFFQTIYSFVLKEDTELENGGASGTDAEKAKGLDGVTIIRVAAFCFAIISWRATAAGMSEYVFGPGWQAHTVSFAIQAILFVFNLKLPFYFHRIGVNTDVKRGGKRKLVPQQIVIVIFYAAVMASSSLFSFVYICSHVVYEHQSGYVDDSAILSASYREILNDTEDYVTEYMKATRLMADSLLGNMEKEYPAATSGPAVSKQDLENELAAAEVEFKIAKEEYDNAQRDVEDYLDEMDLYAESRIGTAFHDRQDMWQQEYEKAKKNWENAKLVRDEKEDAYEMASRNQEKAQAALKAYKDSKETIIAGFLLEMLKAEPDPEEMEKRIFELNESVIALGTEANLSGNFSKLVESTQKLTMAVEDYVTMSHVLSGDGQGVLGQAGIEYMREHVADDIAVPDPQKSSFETEYDSWRKTWASRLDGLKNLIQRLPRFSEGMKNELRGSEALVDISLLEKYVINDKLAILEELNRRKLSDINVMEKAFLLLFGKYWITAWISLFLALFLDVSSLLAGLFIYGIRDRKSEADETG